MWASAFFCENFELWAICEERTYTRNQRIVTILGFSSMTLYFGILFFFLLCAMLKKIEFRKTLVYTITNPL